MQNRLAGPTFDALRRYREQTRYVICPDARVTVGGSEVQPQYDAAGYAYIWFALGDGIVAGHVPLAHLVAAVHLPPKPVASRAFVEYVNGDISDCRAANLRWQSTLKVLKNKL